MGQSLRTCVRAPQCCKKCNIDLDQDVVPYKPDAEIDSMRQVATREEEEKHPKLTLKPTRLSRRSLFVDSRRPSQAITEAATAVVSERPKSLADRRLISVCLSRHFIFSGLTDEGREAITNQMRFYEIGAKELIFQQNQPGINFFILATGRLEVIIDGELKNTIKSGDGFGELALLHDSRRSATIKTIDKSTLWGLDRDTFQTYVQKVNTQNYELNKQFISSVRIFAPLTEAQKENLLTVVNTHRFKEGHRIVNEGDPGEILYIIKEGSVLCTSKEMELRRMYTGEFFGELALLQGGTRTATVTAVDNEVICLSIGREDLRKVLGDHLKQIIYQNTLKIAMERSQFLRLLSKDQKLRLTHNMRVESFSSGNIVTAASTLTGSHLWIVVNGYLRYRDTDMSLEVYTCIGDDSLSKPEGGPLGRDIVCASDTADVACITRQQLEENIGGHLLEVTANSEAWKMLQQVEMLKGLPAASLEELTKALRIEDFQDGAEIVRQNNPGNSLYIIKSGKVDVFKDSIYIRTISKLDYFGERSVLFNDFRSASVLANGEVSCWILNKVDFLSITDESVQVRMMKRIELQNDRVRLEELSALSYLGPSGPANLFLVKRRDADTLYVLKTVSRKYISHQELEENLAAERLILLQLDSTFIIKLVKTFKDEKRVYFLQEYVRGIDMFDVLKQKNALSDEEAKFYIACLIEILEHLHDRQVIHRDVNPESLLVDEEGYLKLVNCSRAKIVAGRTYTIVGSPHYMAPEMITGKGYTHAVDLWSAGIMLYEFCCGGVPFGEEEEDPIIIYEKILEGRLIYPSFVDSMFQARPLIEQLLSKSPAMRLGGTFDNLKDHPWFSSLLWVSRHTESTG